MWRIDASRRRSASKPADTKALDGTQLAWLCGQLRGLKLAQPMGAFAAFSAQLEKQGERVRRVASPEGPPRLVRVRVRRRDGKQRDKPAMTQAGPEEENVILAHTAPAPLHSPYAEPGILVRNYTTAPTTEGGRVRLAILAAREREARAAWDANGAPEPAAAVKTASVID